MKKRTPEEFIARAVAVHGSRYDYSATNYIGIKEKVTIGCAEHGSFLILADNHMQGKGCQKCARERTRLASTNTQEQWIEKARAVHGFRYDYSQVDYKGSFSKVLIVCSQHGPFEITPNGHTQGAACKRCADDRLRKTMADFLNEAHALHGNKFDYSQVEYQQSGISVTIICPQHGPFNQTPYTHLHGSGCQKCANEKRISAWTGRQWAAIQANREATLYVVRFTYEDESFFKVGITLRTVAERFKEIAMKPYRIEVVAEFKSINALVIFETEAEIKRLFKPIRYRPQRAFNGHTECYKEADAILDWLSKRKSHTTIEKHFPQNAYTYKASMRR